MVVLHAGHDLRGGQVQPPLDPVTDAQPLRTLAQFGHIVPAAAEGQLRRAAAGHGQAHRGLRPLPAHQRQGIEQVLDALARVDETEVQQLQRRRLRQRLRREHAIAVRDEMHLVRG